jgi:hypothetical protein
MHRLDRAHRAIPVIIGAIALATVAVLFASDTFPRLFPPRPHNLLGALPLVVIAFAYLAYQIIRRPEPLELLKAIMLAVAFLFWAATQVWPDIPLATLFNDIAIALFVVDVFLVIIGWPATIPDQSFAETFPKRNEPDAPETGHRGQ